MDSFKRFNEQKLPNKECFYSSLKHGTISDSGERLDGHISEAIWNEFNMENMGDCHDHYLKEDVIS